MMYGYRGLWMFPVMLFCIVLIVIVVVLVIKFFNRTNNSPYADKKAIDVLNDKLASGEISEEEYQRKKQLINEK
ncbi:MAG TPA: SHOCT domain-containing protein [Ruminiclostridium sp.]